MSYRPVREWQYLGIDSEDGVSRAEADRLIVLADRAAPGLKLKRQTEEGEKVILDGRHRLRMQQVVGILTTGDTSLEILPKVDGDDSAARRGLIHMLAQVEGLELSALDLAHLEAQRYTLLDLLIAQFANVLLVALRRGVEHRYLSVEEDLPRVRGALDVTRQFTQLAGRHDRLACRFDERVSDTPINRLLRAGVECVLNLTQRRKTKIWLTEALSQLDYAGPLPKGAVKMPEFDRMSGRFAPLCRRAKLFLDAQYQNTSSGRDGGIAILFRMNQLFEAWVGQVLRQRLTPLGWSVDLQSSGQHLLHRSGAPVFRMIPDIVLRRGKECHVIDTKWKRLEPLSDPKRGVLQSDIYQLAAYQKAWDATSVTLLYPSTSKNSRLDLLHTQDGVPFLLMEVPLDDPRATAKTLALDIVEMLAQRDATISEFR